MEFNIKVGNAVITLNNTLKAFKIGKLEMVQKWFIKNEDVIKNIEKENPKSIKLESLRRIQSKLLNDMNIIKQSSIFEGQGKIWDTVPYVKYLEYNEKIITTGKSSWDLLNEIKKEVLHEFIHEYLIRQKTTDLVKFLTPIVETHCYTLKDTVEIED